MRKNYGQITAQQRRDSVGGLRKTSLLEVRRFAGASFARRMEGNRARHPACTPTYIFLA
jgi:hypothetical protein